MTDQISISKKLYFMKGKSRHWFWPLLLALLIGLASLFASAAIVGFASVSGSNAESGFVALAVALQLLVSGGMAAVLLGYGLCNTVKAYRVLFVLLACFQLPAAAASLMNNLSMIHSATQGGSQVNIVLSLVQSGLGVLSPIAWIVSLLIVALGKPATAALRASSALLALFTLCNLIYSLFLRPYLPYTLDRQAVDPATIGFIMAGVNLAVGLLYAALAAFFFGAMSFSKRRPPLAPAAPAPPAGI